MSHQEKRETAPANEYSRQPEGLAGSPLPRRGDPRFRPELEADERYGGGAGYAPERGQEMPRFAIFSKSLEEQLGRTAELMRRMDYLADQLVGVVPENTVNAKEPAPQGPADNWIDRQRDNLYECARLTTRMERALSRLEAEFGGKP